MSLRRRLLRVALAASRAVRPRPEGSGRLLSPCRRKGSVALVWSLGVPAGSDALAQTAPTLAAFDTVVVVTDGLDFRPFVEAGWLFEALPAPAMRARAPGREWSRYLERRIARIRANWAADFEAVLGHAPEAFAAAAALSPQPVGGPDEPFDGP